MTSRAFLPYLKRVGTGPKRNRDLNKEEMKIVIKGNEGTPEIFSKCAVTIVENGEINEIKIDPKAYGIHYSKSTERISLESSLEQLHNPSESFMELAKFNAAVILFLVGKIKCIEEAL